MKGFVAPLLAACLLAGCGGGRAAHGTSTLWVTRDRGERVVLVRTVAAGQTAMEALRRSAGVKTRYGGRYVQAISGVAGSLSARRDWFFFVNGISADRGAAEYVLRPGDVEWWDYRSWRLPDESRVVVGAFPEPFLHGYDGKVRPAAVRYAAPALARGARAIARLIGASSTAPASVPAPPGANVFRLEPGPPRFLARLRDPGGGAGSPVEFVFAGDALRLARDPGLARYRYEVGR